jgi:hypothetical protein
MEYACRSECCAAPQVFVASALSHSGAQLDWDALRNLNAEVGLHSRDGAGLR